MSRILPCLIILARNVFLYVFVNFHCQFSCLNWRWQVSCWPLFVGVAFRPSTPLSGLKSMVSVFVFSFSANHQAPPPQKKHQPLLWQHINPSPKKTVQQNMVHLKLGGGFKHFLFSSLFEVQWSNLTNIFQMGWNHHQEMLFAKLVALLQRLLPKNVIKKQWSI